MNFKKIILDDLIIRIYDIRRRLKKFIMLWFVIYRVRKCFSLCNYNELSYVNLKMNREGFIF